MAEADVAASDNEDSDTYFDYYSTVPPQRPSNTVTAATSVSNAALACPPDEYVWRYNEALASQMPTRRASGTSDIMSVSGESGVHHTIPQATGGRWRCRKAAASTPSTPTSPTPFTRLHGTPGQPHEATLTAIRAQVARQEESDVRHTPYFQWPYVPRGLPEGDWLPDGTSWITLWYVHHDYVELDRLLESSRGLPTKTFPRAATWAYLGSRWSDRGLYREVVLNRSYPRVYKWTVTVAWSDLGRWMMQGCAWRTRDVNCDDTLFLRIDPGLLQINVDRVGLEVDHMEWLMRVGPYLDIMLKQGHMCYDCHIVYKVWKARESEGQYCANCIAPRLETGAFWGFLYRPQG